jgi:ABC-type spermidine/putrescine transport system permease subunit II
VGLTLFFRYCPLFVIFLYSFNAQRIQVWPIQEWTTSWYGEALSNPDVRDAFLLSIEVAFFAMVIALVLGSLASPSPSTAIRSSGATSCRSSLSSRSPLPGIVTGIASTRRSTTTGSRSTLTIVIGPRRSAWSSSTTTSSPGCDAPRRRSRRRRATRRRPWQTFRFVTLPVIDGDPRRRPPRIRPLIRRDHRDHVHRWDPGDDP